MLEDDALAEVEYENRSTDALVGNIYKGIARDVLSGLASFIDVGLEEGHNLFLSSKEVNGAILKKNGIRRSDHFPIQKAIRQGQQLIVQLKRGGIGGKNAQGTTKISLAGRYWIFMPKDSRMGISRRIPSVKERDRLKKIARDLKRPEEGLIARTAAIGASKDELERDFNYLLGTWKGVEEASAKSKAPALLYEGPGFIEGFLRDRLIDDVDRIVIDAKTVYDQVIEYLDYLHMNEFADRVELYRKRKPLFEHYDVETMIEQSLSRSVALPGGGNIVIEETEALVAIDVNTGSNIRFKGQGDAIFNTNMAAALEIPKQLRLRKISGIIIVDFVDMVSRDHQRKLLAALQQELKKDRVPTDFVDMTQLGLVEITRKRKGESLADMLSEDDDDDVASVPVPPIRKEPPPIEVATPARSTPKKKAAKTIKAKKKPAAASKKKEKAQKEKTASAATAVAEAPAKAKKPTSKKPAGHSAAKRRKTIKKTSAQTAQPQVAQSGAKTETATKPKRRRKPTAKKTSATQQPHQEQAVHENNKSAETAVKDQPDKKNAAARSRRKPAKGRAHKPATVAETATQEPKAAQKKSNPATASKARKRPLRKTHKPKAPDTANLNDAPQSEKKEQQPTKKKPKTYRRRKPAAKNKPDAA